MRNFPKIDFTDKFSFLIQYLLRKWDDHTQCDAKTLEKSLIYLLFLLLRFLQRTYERLTQLDAIFFKSTFYRPVIIPNSALTEDVRRPYSVSSNISRKKNKHTCCFVYFSFYRGHATAILSKMGKLSEKVLHTCFFSYF